MVGNHERGGQGRSGKYIVFMLSHENWNGGTALGKGGGALASRKISLWVYQLALAYCCLLFVLPPGIVGRFEVRGPGIGSRRPGEDRPGPIKNIWFPEDGPN